MAERQFQPSYYSTNRACYFLLHALLPGLQKKKPAVRQPPGFNPPSLFWKSWLAVELMHGSCVHALLFPCTVSGDG